MHDEGYEPLLALAQHPHNVPGLAAHQLGPVQLGQEQVGLK